MQVNKLIGKAKNHGLKVLIICLAWLSSDCFSQGQTIAASKKTSFEALINAKQIKAEVHIATKGARAPKQQVVVEVAVSSLLAFDGDIDVQYFDVENSIVVASDQPAILNIKQLDGQQWFIQKKVFNVYPLKAGTFSILPLTVNLGVIGDEDKLSGTIATQPTGFSVAVPEQLIGIDNYIVSPNLTFTLTQSQIEQTERGVGSAVTLTYQLKAAEQHALTLPTLTLPALPGAQMYRKPAEKRDEFERFEKYNTAILTQSITLIFDDEGQFDLPEQTVQWWNPKTNTLTEKRIKPDAIVIGDGKPDLINLSRFKAQLKSIEISSFDLVQWLYFCVLSLFIIFIAIKTYTYRTIIKAQFHRLNQTQSKRVTQQFYADISVKNYPAAIASLYQLLDIKGMSYQRLDSMLNAENQSAITTLKAFAFGQGSKGAFSQKDAAQLVKAVLASTGDKHVKSKLAFSMKLNPEK